MQLFCPGCRRDHYSVVQPGSNSTLPFRPNLDTDPALMLLCERCGWMGRLQWLATMNHNYSLLR